MVECFFEEIAVSHPYWVVFIRSGLHVIDLLEWIFAALPDGALWCFVILGRMREPYDIPHGLYCPSSFLFISLILSKEA